ncbi:MAG: hypothetical protein IJU37_07620 [Desulfovibrio sp.]|nr:hypothetical protein [Desulfovibrio sp.]
MTSLDPLSGITLYVPDGNGTNSISFAPSWINDVTAAQDEVLSANSSMSFNETQFRIVAANMDDIGAIVSHWA